jgi:hypothetical protein
MSGEELLDSGVVVFERGRELEERTGQHRDLDHGRFHQGRIAGERDHLRKRLQAFVNHIEAAAMVRVVELAHSLFARFLQLPERRPFEEELAGQRSNGGRVSDPKHQPNPPVAGGCGRLVREPKKNPYRRILDI